MRSLRAAIDAKCRDCIYDPLSGLGNWRQQVTACTCTDCPLYPVRPISMPDPGYVPVGERMDDRASSGAETPPLAEERTLGKGVVPPDLDSAA